MLESIKIKKIMENNFSIFVPIETLEKGTDKNGKETMIIGGAVSNELTGPDLDGEVIEIEGMDLTKFMSKGFVNYNHLASKDPSMIIGEPISFEKNTFFASPEKSLPAYIFTL